MDLRKILENFDAVENQTRDKAASAPAKKDAMKAILESFDRVAEGKKPDFLDVDKDGDKKEPMAKAAKEKEEDVKESSEEELEEAIMVSAEGSEAEALLQILKLSGMPTPAPAPMPMDPAASAMPALPPEPGAAPADDLDTIDIEMQDEYSNSPSEVEQGIDSVIASGTDLHRSKDQYAAAAPGDNPMKAFEGKFKALMADLLKD